MSCVYEVTNDSFYKYSGFIFIASLGPNFREGGGYWKTDIGPIAVSLQLVNMPISLVHVHEPIYLFGVLGMLFLELEFA